MGQIGSGGVADGSTTTIPLSSTTNLPTDTGITLVIDRVDSNGTATASLEETIVGIVSGNNIVSALRGVEGTAQAHSAGAVVELLWASDNWNDAVDGIVVAHNQDGTHKSGAIYTAPDFNGTEVTIDADADTTMTADTDDQIDWKLGGSDRFRMKTSDFDVVTATGNIQVAGADPKRGIYIPAAALTPATTTGCAAIAQSESSTNKVNYKTLDFDQSTEEYAWLLAFAAPDWWDLSTITVKFHWTAASGTGDVIWGVAGIALSNDDALDTALGTAQTVTDTLIATGDVHTTSATSAITIGGTPAKGDLLFLRVYRDADAGGDTLNADAKLLGITVKYGKAQEDDQ